MKKQKTLLTILALLLVVGLLGACAAPAASSTATEPAGKTEAAATDAPGADEPYPVIRMAYTRIFATDSEAKIEEALNVIMREEAHAEIDLIPVDFSSMNTQFNLMLTGGEDSIDIFSSFWYMPMSTLYANGQLAPLNDLLESDGQGILDLFSDVPGVLECSKVDGEFYGLPSVGPYATSMIYIVKEGASNAANIDWSSVKTLDDVTTALVAMKEANPDKFFVPGATQTYWIPKDIDYLGDTNFLGVLTDPLNSTQVVNYYESDYFKNLLDNVNIWEE